MNATERAEKATSFFNLAQEHQLASFMSQPAGGGETSTRNEIEHAAAAAANFIAARACIQNVKDLAEVIEITEALSEIANGRLWSLSD